MKLGLMARADQRGLGRMTHGFYRHMHPDRVLVVREPGSEERGFSPNLALYPDAQVITYDRDRASLPEEPVRAF